MRRTECELHGVPLLTKQLFNDRDVAMVTPRIEYVLQGEAFPHHTPFYYSANKTADSQVPHTVVYCPDCDAGLERRLNAG